MGVRTDTQHLAAGCLVLNREKTKVLVIYHPRLQKWVIPGGHVENDEAPHEAAVRETKEETGIDAHLFLTEQPLLTIPAGTETPLPFPVALLRESIPATSKVPAHHHIDFIYLAHAEEPAGDPPLHEMNGARWVTKEELLHLDTFESIRQLCRTLMM